MRLHVLREAFLRSEVQLHHGVGQRLREAPEGRDESQHRPAERAVDLLQGRFARIVHIYDGHVAEKAVAERLAAGVRRRVARAHELDALQGHPRLVRRAVEAAVLHQLPEERDHALGAVLVHVGEVDFVAEQD